MLLGIVEVYLGVMVLGWLVADRAIFLPPPPGYAAGGDIVRVPTAGGQQIGLLALTNAAPARGAVLFFHGNGEDLSGGSREILAGYRALGLDAYAFDYRGYGISDGTPSTRRALEDGEAAFRHLVDGRGVRPERLLLHGRSLGAAIALDVAARHRVGGVIVESGFLTAFRVRTRWPLFPVDKFRSDRRIREVRSPVFVLHGEQDEAIPCWHGRELYRLAAAPKRAWWVAGAGHNDVCERAPDEFWRRVAAFAGDALPPAVP